MYMTDIDLHDIFSVAVMILYNLESNPHPESKPPLKVSPPLQATFSQN